MRNVILFAIAVSIASCTDGRVYYVENLDGGRNNDAIYPIVEQQASRDLDLAFSAGDTVENENVVSPARKAYTLTAPEKPYIESNRDADRPIAYYKLTGPAPIRRGNSDDVILVPQGARKLMKLNGNNKGEGSWSFALLLITMVHDSRVKIKFSSIYLEASQYKS